MTGGGDDREHGVGQGGFARARAAGNHNVLTGGHGLLNDLALRLSHDAVGHILLQGKDPLRGFAQHEGWRRHHGRHKALEPRTTAWQHGTQARGLAVARQPHGGGDQAQKILGLGRADYLARVPHATAQAFDPNAAIGIGHDFHHIGLLQIGGHGPHGGGDHVDHALVGFLMGAHASGAHTTSCGVGGGSGGSQRFGGSYTRIKNVWSSK